MDTQLNPINPTFVFHHIPTEVSRRDFNRYINPHLQRPHKGPKPTLSLYKIFNDILSVLHTGIQWDQPKQTATNSMTPTSTNGTIAGRKMARIQGSLRPQSSICITPISSTPRSSTVMAPIP